MAAQLWWMDSFKKAKKAPAKGGKKPKGFDGGGLVGDVTNALGMQGQASLNNFQATSPAAADTLSQANSQAAGGAGPASGTIGALSNLSQSLSAAANGQGPNPALEQLRQTTSANINNATGMAASARGINPALAARMAVDTAGSENQAAAGQAATLSAQQQIAARQQQMQSLEATGGMQLGQQAGGANLLGTAGGLDLSAQGINAGVAGQNASLQTGMSEFNAGQNTRLLGGIFGGLSGASSVGGSGGGGGGWLSSLLGGGGGAGAVADVAPAALIANQGGRVPAMAGGGVTGGDLHSYLDSLHGRTPAAAPGPGEAAPAGQPTLPNAGSIYAHGGKVPAMLSPGEKVLPPGTTPAAAGTRLGSAPTVPGKPQVRGDSPKNDTVHAKLTPGSIVLPRTVVNAKNPGKAAASFVASLAKRSGRGRALGGRVAKSSGPQAEGGVRDLSSGGYVHGGAAKAEREDMPERSKATARGVGRQESRRRMSTSKERKFQEAE